MESALPDGVAWFGRCSTRRHQSGKSSQNFPVRPTAWRSVTIYLHASTVMQSAPFNRAGDLEEPFALEL